MRSTIKAVALVVALSITPSLIAQPRAGGNYGDLNPLLRFAKMIKQLIVHVLDEPQAPPPHS